MALAHANKRSRKRKYSFMTYGVEAGADDDRAITHFRGLVAWRHSMSLFVDILSNMLPALHYPLPCDEILLAHGVSIVAPCSPVLLPSPEKISRLDWERRWRGSLVLGNSLLGWFPRPPVPTATTLRVAGDLAKFKRRLVGAAPSTANNSGLRRRSVRASGWCGASTQTWRSCGPANEKQTKG